MSFRLSRVAALLFCSGACALVYQVAWFRELRLIFGASTAASAAVMAVFMGGLGLGGARLGRRADTTASPLLLYAHLELGVAIMAAVTPLLVRAANAVYLASGGSEVLGSVGAAALRLALSVVVLGPATFLMGGTLPAAARAVGREDDPERRSVAALYGVNTMGAVLGTLLANFLLLEVFGTKLTLWTAALVNLLVGVIARMLARRGPTSSTTPARDDAAPGGPSVDAPSMHSVPEGSAPVDRPGVRDRLRWFPPAAAALVGAAFMLMELTWYRMLAPLLGGSSYTFGLILAVALVGVGIGGGLYSRMRTRATLRAFAMTCSLEALFIVIPYALGDRLALVTAMLRPFCRIGFMSGIAVWTAVAVVVVLPAAIVSGAQFPLIIGLYGRGAKAVGRDVGSAYLANTLGAIGGSIAGGFGLIPLLGAVGCWRLIVVVLALGAVVALALDARERLADGAGPRIARLAVLGRGIVVPTGALLLVTAPGPSAVWRHSGIGAGRADTGLEPVDSLSLAAWAQRARRSILWESDGVESSVALSHSGGFAFVVNGKADGHAVIDAPTQVMGGLLPAMLHPDTKSALVVGLGTGSTAGWLGAIPSIDRVDVVELEPAILRVARDCTPVNHGVLDNPKVHVQLADAREALRTTSRRYDLIFSEPSNPYRAGISSLYTHEFYRAASERLQPGGYFVQWMQAYEIDGWAVATALVTLRQVFEDITLWEAASGDILLLARHQHEPFDAERVRGRLRTEPFASAARRVWRTDSAEGVFAHFRGNEHLVDVLVANDLGAVNTDDQNLLEFAFARSVGNRLSGGRDVFDLALRLKHDEPDVVGQLARSVVLEERWLFQDVEGGAISPPFGARPDASLGPILEHYRAGRHDPALAAWKRLGRAPRSVGEAAVVADCAARAGAPDDEPLIEGAPPIELEILKATAAAGEVTGPWRSICSHARSRSRAPIPGSASHSWSPRSRSRRRSGRGTLASPDSSWPRSSRPSRSSRSATNDSWRGRGWRS